MKTPALLAFSTVTALVLLAACEPETKPSRPHRPTPGHTGSTPTPSPTPVGIPTPSPTPENPTPTPSPTPTAATPTPTPGTTGSLPYGIPVPGKPGFVTSPFNQSGYVDVRGFAPNSEVRDPYSGKIFLVP
jgi:hypothetical protein